jgi:hypothetical protein
MSEHYKIFKSALDTTRCYYKTPLKATFDRKTASLITPQDVEDNKNVTVFDEVLGVAKSRTSLVNACRIIPTDSLELSIPVATGKITANEKVPPLVRSDLKKVPTTRVNFDLWKNDVPVAIDDKALRQTSYDLKMFNSTDAGRALRASKNSQIATAIESTTRTSAGGDWTSTTNPYDDIQTALDSINDTYGFEVKAAAAPPAVWSAFWSNDYVKGSLNGTVYPSSPVFNIPGLPGIVGISDYSLTAASMTLLDSDIAVILAQGPYEAEESRDGHAGYDLLMVREWLQPKLAVNNAAYKLTALLS